MRVSDFFAQLFTILCIVVILWFSTTTLFGCKKKEEGMTTAKERKEKVQDMLPYTHSAEVTLLYSSFNIDTYQSPRIQVYCISGHKWVYTYWNSHINIQPIMEGRSDTISGTSNQFPQPVKCVN